MLVGETNILPFLKAFKKFEAFRMNDRTEQEKAGTIQAFEYCFELSWKIMKRVLQERGLVANSPRETFRMAALEKLIDDPEEWFLFLHKRNLTVHTYQEAEIEEILAIFPRFSQAIKIFLHRLGVPPDAYPN